jgi:hypothetical protein
VGDREGICNREKISPVVLCEDCDVVDASPRPEPQDRGWEIGTGGFLEIKGE